MPDDFTCQVESAATQWVNYNYCFAKANGIITIPAYFVENLKLPTCFSFRLPNFCPPDFSLIQRPVTIPTSAANVPTKCQAPREEIYPV